MTSTSRKQETGIRLCLNLPTTCRLEHDWQLKIPYNEVAATGRICQLESIVPKGMNFIVMQTAYGEVTTKKVIVR